MCVTKHIVTKDYENTELNCKCGANISKIKLLSLTRYRESLYKID